MHIDAHKRAIKESLEEIREAVQIGLENRQRSIGFHCSAVAVDLLELWLHEQGLLDPGSNVKHDWFASVKKAKDKLKIPFDNKEKLIRLFSELENKRNILCYGKAQFRLVIEDYLEKFNQIKAILSDMGVEYE